MSQDFEYTLDPFARETYWVIGSPDLTSFMTAAVEVDWRPRVVFFEDPEYAREIYALVPEIDGGSEVIELDKADCQHLLEKLRAEGIACAIALMDRQLMILAEISVPPDDRIPTA